MALLRRSQNRMESLMQTVEEIQHAIQSLSEDDFERIRRWIWEADWDDWDRQMAKDIEAGTLDFLVAEAMDERDHGLLIDLDVTERV